MGSMTPKQKTSLQRIKDMRAMLDEAERIVRKGRMYKALLALEMVDRAASMAAQDIALETLPGTRRYYDVFSIKDKNGKHVEWGAF
jgi:hypothetical protein